MDITKKEIIRNMTEYIKNKGNCAIIVDKKDIEDFNTNYLTELKKEFKIKVIDRTFCIYERVILNEV